MTPTRKAELLRIADQVLAEEAERGNAGGKYSAMARALKELLEGTGETVAIEQVGGDRLREKARE